MHLGDVPRGAAMQRQVRDARPGLIDDSLIDSAAGLVLVDVADPEIVADDEPVGVR
jgi:hypothetical protein